jgi:hypothetical protein
LGFSGLRGFGSRISVFLGGYERAPKTQPFHIVKRCRITQEKTFGSGLGVYDKKIFKKWI